MNVNPRILGGVAVVLGALTWLLLSVPAFTAAEADSWSPSIVAIPSPAASSAGAPQVTTSNRGALLSWIEQDGSTAKLRFAERTTTGWTEPGTVGSGSDWSINPMDVPSVLRLADGTLVASWLRKSGAGMHANEVRLSYSRNDGRTWMPSFTPHQENAATERLFASLFRMPGGGLGLVWLDGRAMGPGTATAGGRAPNHPMGADHAHQQVSGQHAHQDHNARGAAGGAGAMTVRFASFDSAWKQTADMLVDPRVCECCSTAVVITSDGALAAYRNRSDDEIRDIYVSRFEQGRWSAPVAAYADNWRIPACPVNGPALSALGRDVAIVWYTVKQDQGHAYAALSTDAGRRFGAPIRLDDGGSLGRVDVELLPDGSAVATWIEVVIDGGAELRVRRITREGARSAPVRVTAVAASRGSGHPRIARHSDEILFAWTEAASGTGQSSVRTAVARIPSSLMQ